MINRLKYYVLQLGDPNPNLKDVKEKHYVRLQFATDVTTLSGRHVPTSHPYIRLEDQILQLIKNFNQLIAPHIEVLTPTPTLIKTGY